LSFSSSFTDDEDDGSYTLATNEAPTDEESSVGAYEETSDVEVVAPPAEVSVKPPPAAAAPFASASVARMPSSPQSIVQRPTISSC